MHKQRRVIVVPHTHWDRAWYLPFERMRIKLLRMMDNLLDLLERRPEYRTFCLDGQTILLEDYLVMRPEMKPVVMKLIKSGRLTIGPWYVLPDEFLVSGESLVRNLLTGTRMANAFGRCMKVGYQPDSFGHVTQMPQILNGFGIDNFLFMRGGGDFVDKAGGVFEWQSPNNQGRVTAIYEAGGGYWNLFAWGIASDRIRFLVDTLDSLTPSPSLALKKVRERIRQIDQYGFPGDTYLMTNGVDHLPAQPQVPDLIAYCNRKLKGARLEQGSFEDFVSAVNVKGISRPSCQGELHEGKHWTILAGVYSTRTYLKQANIQASMALERTAEPLATLAWLAGIRYPHHELSHAWKELLKNHPHDDVCGCSVDAVHEDNMTRARNVTEASTGLAILTLQRLAASVVNTAAGAPMPKAPAILVSNALTQPRSGWIHIPQLWVPNRLSAKSGGLVTAAGNAVPGYWKMIANEMAEVRAYCPNVPALGWTVLQFARRRMRTAGVRTNAAHLTMENTFLRVRACKNGTVSICEKATGRVWNDVGLFEDREEAGDSYDYSPLARSPKPVTRLKRGVKWRLEMQHGLTPVLRGELTLCLPSGLSEDRKTRTRTTTDLNIMVSVTLAPGSKQVDFLVEFTNTVKDHRLRMAFPTGCRTQTVRAASPFDLVERPIHFAPRPDYQQSPAPTHHCDGVVSVAATAGGVAVITEGLHEYEAVEKGGRVTLYITLLRAFGWLSRKDLVTRKGHAGHEIATPDGQALRPHKLRLAFRPHNGREDEPGLLSERDCFLTNLTAASVSSKENRLPPSAGLFSIAPAELHVTAVKKAEDRNSLVVRFVNLGRNPVTARISLGFDVKAAWMLNLDERRLEPLRTEGCRTVNCVCCAKEIVTLELVPAGSIRSDCSQE